MVMELSSFQCVEMAIFDAATFSGGGTFDLMNSAAQYQYFTGNGFQYPVKILKMYNASNVPVVMSYTQILSPTIVNVPNDFLPVGGTFILDVQANHSDNSAYGAGTLNGRQGQLIWGNAVAGVGKIYIAGYL